MLVCHLLSPLLLNAMDLDNSSSNSPSGSEVLTRVPNAPAEIAASRRNLAKYIHEKTQAELVATTGKFWIADTSMNGRLYMFYKSTEMFCFTARQYLKEKHLFKDPEQPGKKRVIHDAEDRLSKASRKTLTMDTYCAWQKARGEVRRALDLFYSQTLTAHSDPDRRNIGLVVHKKRSLSNNTPAVSFTIGRHLLSPGTFGSFPPSASAWVWALWCCHSSICSSSWRSICPALSICGIVCCHWRQSAPSSAICGSPWRHASSSSCRCQPLLTANDTPGPCCCPCCAAQGSS